ncbi:hypothetical protein RZS08_54020, partial [Arthrospira platensis SPKY1]|nr:hypothetical protein [Arthrospira platensis SPKY1]
MRRVLGDQQEAHHVHGETVGSAEIHEVLQGRQRHGQTGEVGQAGVGKGDPVTQGGRVVLLPGGHRG